ncbi:MAG TPA: antitoxin Xre/MbcA/ParS toxin-binding domain-containing protein [Nitrospiraceae bacterium]|nr:antitoxin Xre/MbcA/ParS toxin-binding domain-containing protein [Nitrospiraceae bacterium]
MATPEGLIKVLGGSVVLKQRVRTVQDLDRLAQDGLPFQALEQVMGRFRLGRLEVEKVLSLPSRTFARRKEAARMRADESDRLIRVARVGAQAVEVLGTEERAAAWLHRPNRALGNRLPLDLLSTDLGAKQVEEALSRTEHGVIS